MLNILKELNIAFPPKEYCGSSIILIENNTIEIGIWHLGSVKFFSVASEELQNIAKLIIDIKEIINES